MILARAGLAKLVVTNGPEKRVVPLGDSAVTIGRDPENSITIEGADVSRKHCRIEPDGPSTWRVVDLGSKNGTLLNGRAVSGPSRFGLSDKLTVGDATLVIVSEDHPDAALAAVVPARKLDEKPESSEDGWPHVSGEPFELDEAESVGSTSSLSSSAIAPGMANLDRRATRGFLKDRLLLLSQEIASELDLDRLLDAILDACLDFTGFERGILLLEENGALKPVLARKLEVSTLPGEERTFSRRVIELALKRRDATLVRDVPDPRAREAWDPKTSWTSLGLKSALCIPLVAPVRGQRPTARPGSSIEERRRSKVPTRLLGAIYLDSTKEVRPFDAKDRRLLRTVGAHAAIALQKARLHQQATTDPLTQLANRGFFEQLLSEELKRALDTGAALSILMLDIDRFKSINDRWGHQVGDVVLREVAKRVRDTIRRDDVAGRYGGEEFVVVLPGATQEAAKVVAQKIRTALKASPIGDERVPVTASIGIATLPDHGRDGATLTKRADQALYLAKHSGRDRAEVWRAALDKSGHRMDSLAGLVSGDAARDQRNLKLLLEMVTLARANLTATEYLDRVLEKVLDLTRGERALLFLGDDPEKMRLAASRERADASPQEPGDVRFSSSSVRTALQERRAHCFLDAPEGEWQRSGPSSSIESLRLKTVMCVPLTNAERLLGALYVDDRAARREFTPGDLVTLEALASQLALALALDPRFSERASLSDDVAALRRELERLKSENEKLRESQRLPRAGLGE